MPSANLAVLVQVPLVLQAQYFSAPHRIAGGAGFGHADHVQYVKLDRVPFYSPVLSNRQLSKSVNNC